MYYEAHEIYGSELPIVHKKRSGLKTFDEIIEQELLPLKREPVAYLEQKLHGKKVFLKLYSVK